METSVLQVIVLLGTAVWGLTLLARRLRVPAPIVLLLGGVPLAFVPWLTDVRLQPELVLFVFLPALLFPESRDTSLGEIRANLRVVMLSAIGLVIATAAVVAVIGHALGLSWPVAWILGAVLAPTDATAVTAVAGRMPRRTLTILRAESLINDGTALVIFGIAVDVATGHDSVGPGGIAWDFLISYVGGVGIGLAAGWLSVRLRGLTNDSLLSNTVSVLTPFAAFLAAEEIHASGVLAVVVAGLYLSQAGSLLIAAQDRLRVRAFWQLVTFLLNGTLFVLVGLELRGAVTGLTSSPLRTAVIDAILVAVAVMAARFVWTNTTPYVIRALDRRPQQRARRMTFRGRLPNAWSGFRGAVSLAAALAVPSGVPGRDLIIVVTFGVILITLVVQGLTLPAVLRWARLPEDTSETEMEYAESKAVDAALRLLPGEADRLAVDPEIFSLVRAEVEERRTELAESALGGNQTDNDRADAGPTQHATDATPAIQSPAPENLAANRTNGDDPQDDAAADMASPDDEPRSTPSDGELPHRDSVAGSNATTPDGLARDGRKAAITNVASRLSRREQYRRLRLALIQEKRKVVVGLRDQRRIDDTVLRRYESILDAEELRLGAGDTD
ncbi:Na+/H+ antiporter [Actinoplanes sp. N902-109]|uniref:Na+/H+ antiporter n=1 Tax=Actinoplanes sp. (strain N902-109) TaxID=649831 RepID=UPI00032950DD|nr:Na+/H+ antiporter [Actinoplanes sp. N902-109]AGL14664.1 Na+/H+ antiporter [Actinoplanes sp. N902-109]